MVFPSSARNEKNLRIIGELATIHGIDEITMRKLGFPEYGFENQYA